MVIQGLLYGPGGVLYVVGTGEASPEVTEVLRITGGGGRRSLAQAQGPMDAPFFAAGGSYLVYGTGRTSFAVAELGTGETHAFLGSFPALSADGGSLAFVTQGLEGSDVNFLSLSSGLSAPVTVVQAPFSISTSSSQACASCPRQGGIALSPDGSRVAFQGMPREDWELFLAVGGDASGGSAPVQLTREIQHDLYPTFLADNRLLAMKGEGRHRRSHLYDLETGEVTWLFRNNTVRTVAPEYEWAPSPDGSKLLLVAERDGNTVSPERGVYLMDLSRKVGRDEVLARVRENLAAERDLRALADKMYGPSTEEIQGVLDRVSMSRIFEDETALFQFGSKHISQPGNRMAIDYMVKELREVGYEPELQWFDARGAESANVVVTLPGTVSPDVVYAVSAHFDSNNRSPGADDNTSATVGLLEMARVIAHWGKGERVCKCSVIQVWYLWSRCFC